MEDSQAVKILIAMLDKYPFTDEEKAALREAIGLMGWTKLVEGFNDRRKKARDKRMREL